MGHRSPLSLTHPAQAFCASPPAPHTHPTSTIYTLALSLHLVARSQRTKASRLQSFIDLLLALLAQLEHLSLTQTRKKPCANELRTLSSPLAYPLLSRDTRRDVTDRRRDLQGRYAVVKVWGKFHHYVLARGQLIVPCDPEHPRSALCLLPLSFSTSNATSSSRSWTATRTNASAATSTQNPAATRRASRYVLSHALSPPNPSTRGGRCRRAHVPWVWWTGQGLRMFSVGLYSEQSCDKPKS